MYIKDATPIEELGFITAAFNAATAVGALKSLFGIGKKKAALKQIEANAAGKFTSQLPPYADWNEFLDRTVAPIKKKGAEGTTTHRKGYEYWRGRKDSILIKHQIATPEDYAAWLVLTYGLKDGWIDPNAKPGSAFYNNGPFAIGTKIPIFDYEAVTKWANAQNAGAKGASVTPVKLTPQNVIVPPTLPMPQINPAQPSNYFPTGAGNFVAPETQAPPPKTVAAASMLPMLLVGGAAIFFMMRAKKGRR